MASLSSARKAQQGVQAAIAQGHWEAADRGLQYLAGAWLRALAGTDSDDLAELGDRIHGMRMDMMTDFNIDQKVGPEQIAWMLAGVSAFVAQSAKPASLTAHDTRGRILEALCDAVAPISTSDLAKLVNRSVGTVSHELPKMRDAGLVDSISAGRMKLNQPTIEGRKMLLHISAVSPHPVPITLYREEHDKPRPMMDMAQFALLDAVEPNDIEAVIDLD